MAVKPNIDDYNFIDYRNPDAFFGGEMPERGTYRKALKSVTDEIEQQARIAKKTYWGNTPAAKQFRVELDNIWGHSSVRDTLSVAANSDLEKQPELLQAVNDVKQYGRDLLKELEPLTQWNGSEWVESVNESICNKLKNVVNEALGRKQVILENNDLEELKKEIPTLQPFELEYWAEISDEVGATRDYVYGGLTGGRDITEEAEAYITLEHPFVKQEDGHYKEEEGWQISTYWSTDHFEVSSKRDVETIEDVYAYIESLSEEFDRFELGTLYKDED